jgi:hypothetical protein
MLASNWISVAADLTDENGAGGSCVSFVGEGSFATGEGDLFRAGECVSGSKGSAEA